LTTIAFCIRWNHRTLTAYPSTPGQKPYGSEAAIFIEPTFHADQRSSHRNLNENDQQYVIRYGQKCYNAGVLMYFLGKRNIPSCDRANQRIAQLVGTAVLVNEKTGEIVTMYRNKAALKDHRRKKKYRR